MKKITLISSLLVFTLLIGTTACKKEEPIAVITKTDFVASLIGNYRTIDSTYNLTTKQFSYKNNHASSPHTIEFRRDSILLDSTIGINDITTGVKIDSVTIDRIYNINVHPTTNYTTDYNFYVKKEDTLFLTGHNPEAIVYILK